MTATLIDRQVARGPAAVYLTCGPEQPAQRAVPASLTPTPGAVPHRDVADVRDVDLRGA